MRIWIVSKTVLSSIVLRLHTFNPALSRLLQTKCQMCNSTYNFCVRAKDKNIENIEPQDSDIAPSLKSVIGENSDKNIENIEPQDSDIAPSLKSVIGENSEKLCSIDVVPGKGRPPEPPLDCCMSGCANCVWIQYAEELKSYYGDGTQRALKEINTIENESLKAFIKLELGLL